MTRYRIKDKAPNHFIGGRIVGPGDVVELRPGIRPGQWLEPIEAASPEPAAMPASDSAPAKRTRKPVEQPADGGEGEF